MNGWETLELRCDEHLYETWGSLSEHGAGFPLLQNAFASFAASGPPGFDFVFKVAVADRPTLYAFIDATVSPLGEELPDEKEGKRTTVILGAIARLLGVQSDQVVIKLSEDAGLAAGHDEVVLLDDQTQERDDVRLLFIVATSQEKPTVLKKTVSWVRYANLDSLVACGWVPADCKAAIAAAQRD